MGHMKVIDKLKLRRNFAVRKKLQDRMFEVSYIIELLVSIMVGLAILIFIARMVTDLTAMVKYFDKEASLMVILDDAITLAIGAELIKMFCKHTPETIIEVLAFALARELVVEHTTPWENLTTVVAISILFAVRRFLLKRHDMFETPDGLVEVSEDAEDE